MRLPDWQIRLEAFMRVRRTMPFKWGVHDCATFAADGIEAMTGVRYVPGLRGHQTAREAIAAMRAAGGLKGIATQALGEPVAPLMATIGDVVLVPMGKREALGLCNGSTVIGAALAGGLANAPLDIAIAAWRVR